MAKLTKRPSNIRMEQGRFVVRSNDGQNVLARFDNFEQAIKYNQQSIDIRVRQNKKSGSK